MFESAELGHEVDKQTYRREEPKLRQALLEAQNEANASGTFPVITIVAGMDGAGKGETVNVLNEWMDPRLIDTCAFDDPTREERERPRLYRYFRELPAKGRIGLLFGAWYSEPLLERFHGRLRDDQLDSMLEQVVRLEKMLVREGALVLKFWFHLSKDAQRARLKKLAKDPLTAWRVGDAEREQLRHYGKFRRTAEHVLRYTSSGEAPWTLVEGQDAQYRNLTVGRVLLDRLRSQLAASSSAGRPNGAKKGANGKAPANGVPAGAPLLRPSIDGVELLDRLDLSLSLPKAEYERELEILQGRLNLAMRAPRFRKRHSVVALFEGNDAAGKGGAIRRVTAALDARQYDVVPVAAPSEEERAQPYLWRFWRRLPRRGEMTIFDRSWYGRVLVERVEAFAPEPDWMRAYAEINDFESQLAAHGILVVKFWLAISKDEQLKRFKQREKTAWKRFKITPEDYRNREHWDAYARAVNDMVQRTSTEIAPWTLVEATDKRYARVKVLRRLVSALEEAG
jgi:polyphosphate:AMP phosphotransferase